MSKETIKILFLGPSKSGKSTLANFLCGTRDTPQSRYYETNPLRILETDLELEASKMGEHRVVFAGGDARRKNVRVQVWDVSGSSKHQAGWPAVAREADGIVFVFNPAVRNSEKELALWYKKFALKQDELDEKGNYAVRVADANCLVFAHYSEPPQRVGLSNLAPLPKDLEKVKVMETSLDYHSENFKEAFDKLVESIVVQRMNAEEEEVLRNQFKN